MSKCKVGVSVNVDFGRGIHVRSRAAIATEVMPGMLIIKTTLVDEPGAV